MAEDPEIKAKISVHKKELEELKRKCDLLNEENKTLTEERARLDDQLDQKKKELADKQVSLEMIHGKQHRNKKDDPNDAERKEKEIDDWLKDKVLDLLVGEDKKKSYSRFQEYENNSPMIINSVLVRYIPDLYDGDIESLEKVDPHEAYFRLNKKTTFQQLKDTACEFWVIFYIESRWYWNN